ncbi:MAG: hypothetical protein HY775_06225 [Acidobacteria bacterium]|nr:hypothetical protein [Acidobacteriota bacterium]
MRSLDRDELKELLIKSWMTHDAMWFQHLLRECGMDVANRVNKAAARSMAAIEIRRVSKALGAGSVQTFEDLRALIEAALGIVKADFMEMERRFPEPNLIRFDMGRCFALEGMARLGVADRYSCGIFDRVEGWFEGLGIAYQVSPQVEGCMMRAEGRCFREYRTALPPGG